MAYNTRKTYTALDKQGNQYQYTYPPTTKYLKWLLERTTDISKVALLVLTPFEEPRDGSSGPLVQYPTGWALHHLRCLRKQYGDEMFTKELQLLHEYIISGGQVTNPIGLFTYRMRLNPINV